MASNLEILPGLKSYGHAFLQTHALVDTNMNVLIMETVQTTEKKTTLRPSPKDNSLGQHSVVSTAFQWGAHSPY